MKYCIPFFMILVILSTQFSELMVFVSFKMNQDYIAENLCVEKDMEDSTCMGCCQLEKRINEQQENKKEFPEQQNFKHDFTFYITSSDLTHFVNSRSTLQHGYSKIYKYTLKQDIFRPPKIYS